ncbi:hypothetical protein C0L86_08605 [Streptomyces sp. SCA2-2]|uniref:Uncharacterized protein n=1 Tax=Streptomyces koyangensis TaxID=188770 RepID=A0A385D8T6_9ACTN|nr:hypothetical protein D0C37_09430 [Streptomyces koyangensis]PKR44018.1 hypothetical protein CWE27_17295 [Streptomyces sp. EAG2]RZF02134.1 hypothetical protein C0L86_08605 [Streptomyces sp. SCA2-2]
MANSARHGHARSGRKDGYTPHPGLRTRVRRVRACDLPRVEAGPSARTRNARGARPPPIQGVANPRTLMT